jgi:hypothetical protein
MKDDLDIQKWQNFTLGELFEIKKGKRLTREDFELGNTPFIGAIDSNNGYRDFIGQDPIFEGNTITVSYNGSVAEAFYQDEPYWASDDINVLYPKFEMNRDKALFVITLIKHEKYRFNYGRKWHKERMEESVIKLPAKNGKPDWDFMEQFIHTHTHNYGFATKPAQNLPMPELKIADWRFYKLDEIFDIKYGVNLELVNLEETTGADADGIRLVSRTDNNNGISAFVKLEKKTPNPANTISVAGGGSVLATFLQADEYYSGRDIYYLQPKVKVDNAVLLFITTLIRREKYRFNYGRQANKSLRTLKIKLPAKDNKPDWEFMTYFVQTLPFSSQI